MRRLISIVAVCLVGSAFGGCDGVSPPSKDETLQHELAERQSQVFGEQLGALPDDGLRTPEGAFTFEGVRGTPVLVSAVYTNCPMEKMCPLLTSKIGKVQARLLDADRIEPEDFRIVLLSFDPERDSPSTLRKYATERGVDPVNAEFVSGDVETIEAVMEKLEIAATEAEDGKLTHNMRTYVTTAGGRVVYGFRKAKWRPRDVVRRMNRVLGRPVSGES